MFGLSPVLLSHLANTLQVGDSEPRILVRVFDPVSNNVYEFQDLNSQLISVDWDKRWDTIVSEATVKMFNPNGIYSPDYNPNKFPELNLEPNNNYSHVFWTETKFEIYAGYGEELLIQFTGSIDDVDINAKDQTLTFKGRGVTKDLLETVIEPGNGMGKWEYTNWIASDIVADMVTKLGLAVEYNSTKYVDEELQKDIEYYIPAITFNFGDQFGDALQKFVETLNHRIYDTRWGSVRLDQVNLKTQDDIEDFIYDDTINIQNLEYIIKGGGIRSHIRVKGAGGVDTFANDQILNEICRGKRRLMSVIVPWADNWYKRKLAAEAYFTQMIRKFRKISFGSRGNPSLDIGDLIKVNELISTATAKYQVTGIRTSMSAAGYFDVIDAEYAAKHVFARVEFTNNQVERVEKLVYEERFTVKKVASAWNATFLETNPHPFKILTNRDFNDNKNKWGVFVSGNGGPLNQGEQSDAIFDIPIPGNGFDYEFNFDYCVDGNTGDDFELWINGSKVATVDSYTPWKKSQRHPLIAGANRIIFRFTKNNSLQKSNTGADYSRLMIDDMEVWKIGWR